MMNMNVIHCHRWAFLQHSTCTNRHVAHPMRNDQYRRHNSWDLVLPTFRNLTMPYSKDIWGHRGPKPCPDVSGTCGVQYKPLLPLYAGCATRNITILKTFSPPEERLGGRGYYRRGLRCEDLDLGRGQDQCKEGMYLPRRTAARTLNDRSLDLEIPGIELTIKIFPSHSSFWTCILQRSFFIPIAFYWRNL